MADGRMMQCSSPHYFGKHTNRIRLVLYLTIGLCPCISISYGEEADATAELVPSPLFQSSPFDSYFHYKSKIYNDIGFTWRVNYSAMQLQRTDGTKDKTATGQLDLIAIQDVFSGKGRFLVYYMDIEQLSGISTSEFSKRNGNITPITDSDEVSFLRRAMYSHKFFDNRVTIAAGKTEPTVVFGDNRFATDDRTRFQAQPLAVATAKDRTTASVGMYVQVELRPWLSLGISANELDPSTDQPATSRDYDYYSIVNLTFRTDINGLGQGNYRFNSVFTDEQGENPETNGYIVSLDQELGENWGTFLRYDDTEIQTLTSPINKSRSFGFYNRSPFGRPHDRFGFGYFKTNSDLGGSFRESGYEAFYRMAITDFIDLSFTIQQIDPAKAEDKFVNAGMRLFLAF